MAENTYEDKAAEAWETPDFSGDEDPFALFDAWMSDARDAEPNDPNAMIVATTDAAGYPNARTVLLKDASPQGFTFYTNFESAKGRELLENPHAALCFYWKSLRRQIRIRGNVEQVSDEEADTYFASRARTSRIGAWASAQSRPLESRFAFEKEIARYGAKHAIGEIPRPPHWSGFRVIALEIEFWHERPFRLHDRLLFTRNAVGKPWRKTRLYP